MEVEIVNSQSFTKSEDFNGLVIPPLDFVNDFDDDEIEESENVGQVSLPEITSCGLARVSLGEIVDVAFRDGSNFRGILIQNHATESGRLINFEIEESRDFLMRDVESYSILLSDKCAIF